MQLCDNFDTLPRHPAQAKAYAGLHGCRCAVAADGTKVMFDCRSHWPLVFAHAEHPPATVVGEFVAFCKGQGWVPVVTSYEQLPGLHLADEAFTHLIDLQDPQFSHGIKCNIKAAVKKGVTVRKLDRWEEWLEMNRIHNELLQRKGIAFDEAEREAMYLRLFEENDRSTFLYGAFVGDTMIAGLTGVFAGDYALFTKAATADAYYSLAPMPLIIHEMCQREKGRFRYFDMNIAVGGKYELSGPVFNIIRFKRQFGARVPVFVHMPRHAAVVRRLYLHYKHRTLRFAQPQ